MIKFSVIIPTYNRPDTLPKAISSVIDQTYKNYEIIVINDAGNDVGEIIKQFPNQNIRYISLQNNLGLAGARNEGLKYASGDYICFLDDDDNFLPNYFDTILKYLNDDYKIYYTDAYRSTYKYFDNENWLISRYVPYSIDYDKNKLLIANISPFNCFVFKREIFREYSFDNSYKVLEDWELLLRISQKYDFLHIPVVTANVNLVIGKESLTSNKQELFKKFRNKIYKQYSPQISKIPNKENIIHEFNKIWEQDFSPTHPLVSIIVLTYNNREFTEQFLLSLQNSTNVIFELIIVDNNSSDGTQKLLQNIQKQNPEIVKIIFNEKNLGFPKAVNQALKIAKAEYVLIANNDIIVTKNWLERLVRLAEKDSKYGVIGVLSNQVSGIQKIDTNYVTLEQMKIFAEELAKNNNGQFIEFPRVTFLCTLLKRKLVEKIGALDERFSPGNFEDDDYCIRALLAGYKCLIAKDVFVHHFGSKSFTADGQKKYLDLLEKNRQIFIEKWGADFNQIIFEKKDIKLRNYFIPLIDDPVVENFERIKIYIEEKDYKEAYRICLETIENWNSLKDYPIKKEDFEELKDLLQPYIDQI